MVFTLPPAALRGRLRGGRQGAAPPGPPVALRAVCLDWRKGFEPTGVVLIRQSCYYFFKGLIAV